MKRIKQKSTAWAVKWRSKDGNHLCGAFHAAPVAPAFRGCPAILFNTRQEARDFIKAQYGYIAERPDLRAAPHYWRMPVAVKVTVTVEAAA